LGEGLDEFVAGDGAVVVGVELVEVLLDGVGRHHQAGRVGVLCARRGRVVVVAFN
jgi:hypothetical protein